jgi:hypothetical protein
MNKKMGEILKRYKKEGVVEKLMREALSDWQEKYKNTPPTYFTDVKKSSKKE